MNHWIKLTAVSALSLTLVTGLTACAPGQNTPGATIGGAAVGGLLGAAAFSGSSAQWVGIVGGALLGSVIGNQIGRYMDRQDQVNMQNAIVHTPVGSEARWTNKRRNITYSVRPVQNYKSKGRYCREYQTRVKINGKWQSGYGKACRKPDGSWHIIS